MGVSLARRLSEMDNQPAGFQQRVNEFFDSRCAGWDNVYVETGVIPHVLRERQAAVLAWIDELRLPSGARVLEIGCGAGWLAVSLGERGFNVRAVDSSRSMVDLATQRAADKGLAHRISIEVGDVHALNIGDNECDLVVAVGVLPWLESVEPAFREMARVARPGGYVLVTADNRMRLDFLLDPRMNPATLPLKRWLQAGIEALGIGSWPPRQSYHDPRAVRRAAEGAGLETIRSSTLGFAPLTFLGHHVMPASAAIHFSRQLQSLANRHIPIFRSTGMMYHLLVRKPVSPPPAS